MPKNYEPPTCRRSSSHSYAVNVHGTHSFQERVGEGTDEALLFFQGERSAHTDKEIPPVTDHCDVGADAAVGCDPA